MYEVLLYIHATDSYFKTTVPGQMLPELIKKDQDEFHIMRYKDF